MDWLTVAAVIMGLLGFAAIGGLLAFRRYHNPLLLVGLVPTIMEQLKPVVVKYVLPYFLRRNTPEVEKRMQDCLRRGGEWDNFNKKCKDKR